MKKSILILALIALFFSCSNEEKEKTKEPNEKDSLKIAEIDVINKGNVTFTDYFENKTMRSDSISTPEIRKQNILPLIK